MHLCYGFSRVVLSKNATPVDAQFVTQENDRRYRDVYPSVAETVLKSTNMDDFIDSMDTAASHLVVQPAGQSLGNCKHAVPGKARRGLSINIKFHLINSHAILLFK